MTTPMYKQNFRRLKKIGKTARDTFWEVVQKTNNKTFSKNKKRKKTELNAPRLGEVLKSEFQICS